MSGHSKWATIKRKKGAADAKRSNQFAKLLRAVEVAAREGGSGDVKANMTLASAVDKARSSSVPVENIERAIKRGSGDLEGGARYVEVTYEGYGQGGVAVFVETLTDNRNRTLAGHPARVHPQRREPRRERQHRVDVRAQGLDPDREGPRRRTRRSCSRSPWRPAPRT